MTSWNCPFTTAYFAVALKFYFVCMYVSRQYPCTPVEVRGQVSEDNSCSVVVHTPLVPELGRQKQVDLCDTKIELKASIWVTSTLTHRLILLALFPNLCFCQLVFWHVFLVVFSFVCGKLHGSSSHSTPVLQSSETSVKVQSVYQLYFPF